MIEAFRSRQPEMPRGTEGELPESKIFDLLSSVGNGEHKALELIVMREGVIYSKSALYQEVMHHQLQGRGWGINRGLPLAHCEKSLSPIGLVTKEALRPDGSAFGYQITKYGLSTGIPFAGLLLKWSYEHPEYSLYKMFSFTGSPSVKDEQTLEKKRAQETRYKIFWEVATNPSSRLRLLDIKNEINEQDHNLIRNHLIPLNKNGVISYEALERGKSYSYFRLKEAVSEQEPSPYNHNKTLSTRAYLFLAYSSQQRPNEYLSVEEIVNQLVQEYPEYKDVNKKAFSQKVASVLTHFERQGHAERKKFNYTFKSEAAISDEQKEAIVSLVTIIDKFKNGDGDTIEEGRRFAQRVANDPNLYSELMLKAREASPFADKTDREEMDSILLSVLQEYPNSTTNQLLQILEDDYDKILTSGGIRRSLSCLVKEEKIVFEKTKSGNVYRVAEEENQTPSALN